MAIKPVSVFSTKKIAENIGAIPGQKHYIFQTSTGGKFVFVSEDKAGKGAGDLYFVNKAGATNFIDQVDSYESAVRISQNTMKSNPDMYGTANNPEGGYFSKGASKRFAELKDTYLQLLQEGYNPKDVEKFVKEIQTNPNTKAPKPKPGTKPLTTPTTSIGSLRKAENYLAGKEASDADNFKGSKINEGVDKNPKANEDLESLKKNDFDRKTCKGSYSRKALLLTMNAPRYESEKYTIYLINDPESLVELSKGTAWSLKDPKYAKMYAKDGVYMIYRNGENKPFAAATSDFSSFVDRGDKNISGTPEAEEIKNVIEDRSRKGSYSASIKYLDGK